MEINENKNDSDNLQLKLLTVTVTVTVPTQVQTSLRREELSSRVISLFLDPSDTHLCLFLTLLSRLQSLYLQPFIILQFDYSR